MDLKKLKVNDIVAVEVFSCMLTCESESESINLDNLADLDKLYKVCSIEGSAVILQKLTKNEETIKIDCPDKAKQIMNVLLNDKWINFLGRNNNNHDLYLSDFQHNCKDNIFPEIKNMIENQIRKINSAL